MIKIILLNEFSNTNNPLLFCTNIICLEADKYQMICFLLFTICPTFSVTRRSAVCDDIGRPVYKANLHGSPASKCSLTSNISAVYEKNTSLIFFVLYYIKKQTINLYLYIYRTAPRATGLRIFAITILVSNRNTCRSFPFFIICFESHI